MIGEVILKNKLFSGESINIEYKVEMPKKSEKYMKTVVAFANGRGGRIVFGVDDKTLNIVGMNPDTIFQTMDLLQMLFQIAVSLKFIQIVTLQSIDDKTIIVVEIHPGPMRPYYIKKQRTCRWNLCTCSWYIKTCGRIYAERINSGRSK